MPENKETLIQRYSDARAALLAALDGLTDAQLTDPTLDGWSIKDHLAHMALWDDIRASEVARISAGHESAWRMGDALDEVLNVMGYHTRRQLSLAQIRWELDTSRQRLLDALSVATERGLDPSLYTDSPLASGHEAQHTAWIKRWRAERGI